MVLVLKPPLELLLRIIYLNVSVFCMISQMSMCIVSMDEGVLSRKGYAKKCCLKAGYCKI